MIISEKIKEKEFEGRTMKDAYLECCKWLSTNVLAINNSNNVTYKIEKIKNSNHGCVRLTLYASAKEYDVLTHNCDVCRESTGNFFMTQNKYMCEVCKVTPYRKRLTDKLRLLSIDIKEG